MKVRITKARYGDCWYADKIGEEFEVDPQMIHTPLRWQHRTKDSIRHILATDCEVVEEPKQNNIAKVGLEVIDVMFGYGKVEHINGTSNYPVSISFHDMPHARSYTNDGRYARAAKFPTCFPADEYPACYPQHEKPRPDLKMDAPVIVWDEGAGKKNCWHFKEWGKTGRIITWGAGRTSHSAIDDDDFIIWDHYELVEDKNTD